jgi:hypothetical protein
MIEKCMMITGGRIERRLVDWALINLHVHLIVHTCKLQVCVCVADTYSGVRTLWMTTIISPDDNSYTFVICWPTTIECVDGTAESLQPHMKWRGLKLCNCCNRSCK